MENRIKFHEEEIKNNIFLIAKKLNLDFNEMNYENDFVLNGDEYNNVKSDVEKLKIQLFDYYALRIKNGDFWFPFYDRLVFRVNNPVTIFSRVKVLVEKIKLTDNESLDVITSLIDEQTDFGILHFLPLLGKKNKKLGNGIVSENHGFGWHYHFCRGTDKDNHRRTKLMFTNQFDIFQKHEGIYCGQHGSYDSMTSEEINEKAKVALIEINEGLIKKYKIQEWMRKPDKFQKFWAPDTMSQK